jgi:hypothetical protein
VAHHRGGSAPGRPASPGPGQESAATPQTRYAPTSDGVHIAYQVIGEGERDMVLVPGVMSHVELVWEDDETADFYRHLAGLAG